MKNAVFPVKETSLVTYHQVVIPEINHVHTSNIIQIESFFLYIYIYEEIYNIL